MCEFNNRTVKSAQTLLTSLDERFDACPSTVRPLDRSIHINNCEAHSKFFALTTEVHGSLTVFFQNSSPGCGLERGTWTTRQRSVCEVSRTTDMLGCSCFHQKLDRLILPRSRVITLSRVRRGWRLSPQKTARLQVISNQEVEVRLGSCCCSHCCLEGRQYPPHPPRQQCSCIDSLSACVPTFHSYHSSPQTSGCSLVYLCAFPCLVLAFLALGVLAFLACHRTRRPFPVVLLPLTLAALATMTVPPLSNSPRSVS